MTASVAAQTWWEAALRAEAVVAGAASFGLELIIWRALHSGGRALVHYHLLPLYVGALLVLAGVYPDDFVLSVAATLASCTTAVNLYNTYYVNVVMLREHLADDAPPRVGRVADLVEDLFLPRYKPSFYPWGPAAQLAFAALVCAHFWARAAATQVALRVFFAEEAEFGRAAA